MNETPPTPRPRVAITTLGCKLNYAESAALRGSFERHGYAVVPDDAPADVIVVNTCTVTEQADAECRQIVRRHLRRSPDAIVAVTGCFAQLQPETIASIEGVRGVFGTAEKQTIPDHIDALRAATSPLIFAEPTTDEMDFVPARSVETDGRTRAFVKIQDGCDYSCSFCTIPLARGGGRSMPFDVVRDELMRLAEERFHEVILSGVNLGEYKAPTGQRLTDVMHMASELSLPYRIRISSVEPNTVTHEMIELMATSNVFCRHLHMPLQSGSAELLRGMRRRYTPDRYAGVLREASARIDGLAVGIDVIVGFPGETQAVFEETMDFLRELPWTYLHVFTYSERPNTPAATYAERVPMDVRRARTARLRALSAERRDAHHHAAVGQHHDVVTETFDVERSRWIGWTDNYVRVAVDLPFSAGRTRVRVVLTQVDADVVLGRPIAP